jgi:hypothetical protein
MTYDDGRIACTDDALVIRRYYFPTGDKRVPYGSIELVRRKPMSSLTGKGRIWGSSDFFHWFNLDPGRPGKSASLTVQISGRKVMPVITPDNIDDVTTELAAHGVTVES